MSGRFRLSPAADAQIDSIFTYTRKRWGDAQAEAYLRELFACFEGIAEGSIPGRPIPDTYGVHGHYLRCGKHFIYWKTLNDGSIGIAEILHERMNLGDRLAASASLNGPHDQG